MSDQLTLYRLFERGRMVGRERHVQCFFPDGRVETRDYPSFADGVAMYVKSLKERGLKPGQRVATLAANHIEHLQLMWAVPLAGGVFHAINPRLSPDEIAYIASDADDRMLVFDPDLAHLTEPLRITHPDMVQVDFGAFSTGDDAAHGIPEIVHNESASAVLCYTSGTTGRPKGVAYSHRALSLHVLTEAMVDGYAVCHADHVLMMVPFCHGAGWGLPYSAFMCGAGITILNGPIGPDRVMDVLAGQKITFTAAVPEVIEPIARKIELQKKRWTGLRILMGGTAPRPETLSVLQKAGIKTMLCWGMTETLSAATMQHFPPDHTGIAPTQGQPLPLTEIALAPGDGDAPELLVRGPCVVENYHAQAGSTRKDGWFPTGDVARIRDDGTLCLTDRKKDLIKSGGEWISPAAIEAVIAILPGVRECAVIGLPHPKWGERPLCCLVADASVSHRAIVDALLDTGRFAKWQIPDDIVALDAFPRTKLNKLDRKALRDAYQHHFQNFNN